MFYPETMLPGFALDETIDLTDEEPGSVPSGELPKHLMVTADGISHTAWLINFNIHVFKHLRLLKFLKETFGFDLFNVWATPDERAHKLADNVVKPLIKRFFAQNLKK